MAEALHANEHRRVIYPMVRATERIGVGDVLVWLVGFDLERASVEVGAELGVLIGERG